MQLSLSSKVITASDHWSFKKRKYFFRWEILICFIFFMSVLGLICQSWSLQGCTQLYHGWFAIYVKLSYTKPQNKVWFLSWDCLINYSIAQLYQ